MILEDLNRVYFDRNAVIEEDSLSDDAIRLQVDQRALKSGILSGRLYFRGNIYICAGEEIDLSNPTSLYSLFNLYGRGPQLRENFGYQTEKGVPTRDRESFSIKQVPKVISQYYKPKANKTKKE